MSKIMWIFLGVVVLLLGAVGVYISLLDWNAHKERLSAQFSPIIGEQIEFSGDLDVSLFPHPKMSAKSVSIINPQTGDTLATIKKMDMAVTLSSVFNGAPDIQSLLVDGAEIWITFDENGKCNWQKQDSVAALDNNEVRLQVLDIKNGVIHLQNKTYGVNADLTDLKAEIQAEALESGPYQIASNFMYEGERYGLALSIDSVHQLDDVGFQLRLRHSTTDDKFLFDGSYNKQTALIKGSFSGEFLKTADVVNMLLKQDLLEEKYNKPMQFSVKEMIIGNQTIDVSHLTVKFDPFFVGTGDVSLTRNFMSTEPKNFSLKYKIVSTDAQPLVRLLKDKFLEYRQGVYMPESSWNGDFDLSIGQIRVSENDNGVWESVVAKGSWQDNMLDVADFYAYAPGEVNFSFSGTLKPQDEKPEIFAAIELEGRDFKTFFNSLNIELAAPVQNAYRAGKLNAELVLLPTEMQINNIKLNMDNAVLEGDLKTVLGSNKYVLNLNANNVNLDNYIFPPEDDIPHDTMSLLQHDFAKLAKWKDYGVDVSANVENLIFRGVPMQNLELEAAYENDELAVEKFHVDGLVDTTIDGAALIAQVSKENPKIETLSFAAKSQNMAVFANKFNIPLPQWNVFELPNFIASGELSGIYDNLIIKTEAVVDGDSFEYDGILLQKDGMFNYDGTIELKTQNLDKLLLKLNKNASASKFLRGVFNANTKIKGSDGKYNLENFDFKLGAASYKGNVAIIKDKGKYAITGKVAASELNLKQIFNAQKVKANAEIAKTENTFVARPDLGKEVFDFSPYESFDLKIDLTAAKLVYDNFAVTDFAAQVDNAARQFNIKSARFKHGETDVQGDFTIVYNQSPRVSGSIKIGKLPVNKIGGSIYAVSGGEVDLSGEFESSAASFDDMLASLSGRIALKTQDITIKGINLNAIFEDLRVREYSKGLFQVVQNNLNRGSTRFEPLNVTVIAQDGMIALKQVSLVNEEETMDISGDIRFSDWRLNTEMKVKYKALPNIDAYTFALTGALNNPTLDISIEKIASRYDEHWKKIEAAEQAKKDEAARKLSEKMASAQELVTMATDDHAAVAAILEQYEGKNLLKETAALYEAQKQRLTEMEDTLQKLRNHAQKTNFTDEDLAEIREQVSDMRDVLAEMKDNLTEYYANDMRQALNQVNEKMWLLQKDYDGIYSEFTQMYEDDTALLRQIGAAQYIRDNADLQKYQTQMEEYHNAVLLKIHDFDEKSAQAEDMPDNDEKLAAIRDLQEYPAPVESDYKQMEKIRAAAGELLLSILNQRQEIYRIEQVAKERKLQKEAAENAGNLLVEGMSANAPAEGIGNLTGAQDASTSRSMMPETNEDQRRTMQAGHALLTPISDGYEAETAKGGIVVRSRSGVEPAGYTRPRQLLKPIEGEVKGATGTIIVR